MSNLMMTQQPYRRHQFWSWLGFTYHHIELEYDDTELPGWMKTEIMLRFSWLDRLRLLATGKVKLDVTQATNVKVDQCISATSMRIIPPWDPEGNEIRSEEDL